MPRIFFVRERLGERLADFHATTLAASAGMDLGFDDHALRARAKQVFGHALGLFDGDGHLAARHRHAILRQDVLRLILVDLHGFGSAGWCRVRSGNFRLYRNGAQGG